MVRTSALILAMSLTAGCGRQSAPPAPVAPPTPPQVLAGRVSGPITAKPTLSLDDIDEVLSWADMYQPKDQFSPGFDASPIEGKPFVITLGPVVDQSSNAHGNFFFTAYDQQKRQLKLTVSPSGYLIGGYNYAFNVSHAEKVTGAYVGQNAFGVQRSIETKETHEHGIDEAKPTPTNQLEPVSTTWTMTLAPDLARATSTRLAVRITGRVFKWGDTPLADCTDTHQQPTITSPEDETIRACRLTVKIDAVTLLGVPPGVTAENAP